MVHVVQSARPSVDDPFHFGDVSRALHYRVLMCPQWCLPVKTAMQAGWHERMLRVQTSVQSLGAVQPAMSLAAKLAATMLRERWMQPSSMPRLASVWVL